MPRINKTQFAVLGCLSIRSMSAYEIKQFIGRSIAHFWTEREGQLYPTLRKLNQDKLVSFHEEDAQKSGKKKIYQITEDGEAAFLQWLSSRADRPVYRNELLLKTFFGSFQSTEKNIAFISSSRKESEEMLQLLNATKATFKQRKLDGKRQFFIELCFDYGIDILNAEIQWCMKSIEKLKKFGE